MPAPAPRHLDRRLKLLVVAGLGVCATALPGPVAALAALVALVTFVVAFDGHRVALALAGATGLLLAFLVVIGAVQVPPALPDCKNDQKQLGAALILYRDNLGQAIHFPAHDGSDLLIALYVGEVTTEPDLFICDASGDTNADGADIRLGNSHCTSYAARRNSDDTRYPGLYTARGASETAMISDDSEGTARFNHEDVCVVLFADGHVETLDTDDPRLRGATRVGQPGLLHPLAN